MELISIGSVNRLIYILLNTQLISNVHIPIPTMHLDLTIDSVSTSEYNKVFGQDMQKTYFMINNEVEVLRIKNRTYQMFYNLGEWGYETRIPKCHICLGTTPLLFGSDYFAQIELSQALEDKNKIYIVKNITKLSGKGAISRINNGLGKNKEAKEKRRTNLVNFIDATIQTFDGQEWMCIEEISKDDLYNDDKSGEVITSFMKKFLQYSLKIEEIIYMDKRAKI